MLTPTNGATCQDIRNFFVSATTNNFSIQAFAGLSVGSHTLSYHVIETQ